MLKPPWQVTWEKTVAAAKKEGRLNFYVGRYGTEPLLNEFRKEFPEIRLVTVNGTGNSLGTRIVAELRAGNVVADLFSGGANTNYEVLYEGKALDSIKSTLILPEVLDERNGTRDGTVTPTRSKGIFLSTSPTRRLPAFITTLPS